MWAHEWGIIWPIRQPISFKTLTFEQHFEALLTQNANSIRSHANSIWTGCTSEMSVLADQNVQEGQSFDRNRIHFKSIYRLLDEGHSVKAGFRLQLKSRSTGISWSRKNWPRFWFSTEAVFQNIWRKRDVESHLINTVRLHVTSFR